MFIFADRISLSLFLLLMLVVAIFPLRILYKTHKNIIWIFILGHILTSVLVLSGLITKSFIPFGVIFFAAINISAIALSMSKYAQVLEMQEIKYLVLFQSFRLPLELILHHWANIGTVPATMTWTGQNYDIITGGLAVLVVVPFFQKKFFFWFFNIAGGLLLINVLRVVLMSSPLPFAWGLENSIQLIAYFPYHFIASVGVFSAFVGHILLTKRLLKLNEL